MLELLISRIEVKDLENFLFTYNLILTVVFTITLTGLYILYLRDKNVVLKLMMLLIGLMIIDNSIQYISEFSTSFEALYENSDLLYVVIYLVYLAILITARAIVDNQFDDPFKKFEWIVVGLSVVLIAGLDFAGYFYTSELLVHVLFLVGLAWIVIKAYKHLRHLEKDISNRSMKLLLGTTLLLCVLGIADNLHYYLTNEYDTNTVLEMLEYRTIAFDFIKLIACGLSIKIVLSSLLHDKTENQSVELSVDNMLDEFTQNYTLTDRQSEIIKLIIDGCTNKEISDLLHITEGTVKAHIYNIFKKTNVSSRNQLVSKILNKD